MASPYVVTTLIKYQMSFTSLAPMFPGIIVAVKRKIMHFMPIFLIRMKNCFSIPYVVLLIPVHIDRIASG